MTDLQAAFRLGFLCSREGFNSECMFDHCAKESIYDDPCGGSQKRDLICELSDLSFNDALMILEDQALEFLGGECND